MALTFPVPIHHESLLGGIYSEAKLINSFPSVNAEHVYIVIS